MLIYFGKECHIINSVPSLLSCWNCHLFQQWLIISDWIGVNNQWFGKFSDRSYCLHTINLFNMKQCWSLSIMNYDEFEYFGSLLRCMVFDVIFVTIFICHVMITLTYFVHLHASEHKMVCIAMCNTNDMHTFLIVVSIPTTRFIFRKLVKIL